MLKLLRGLLNFWAAYKVTEPRYKRRGANLYRKGKEKEPANPLWAELRKAYGKRAGAEAKKRGLW